MNIVDSLIYATAVLCEAEIYTQDKHFEGLERVHYFAKELGQELPHTPEE